MNNNKILLFVTKLNCTFFLKYSSLKNIIMTLNKKNIKHKITELEKEIKFLEDKINEIYWQRDKYQQFYDKADVDDINEQ